jgi:hypothetical protein
VPPRTPTPRWQGDPYGRPPTDAELSKNRRRNRSLIRFFGFLSLVALFGFVVAPMPVFTALLHVPAQFAPLAARAGWWLQVAHPFAKLGLLVACGYVLLHLLIGAVMLTRQTAHRRRKQLQTLLVELPRTPATELGRGVDLFAGLGELLSAAGRLQGREDVLVFGLVNGTSDHKVRLVVRTPVERSGQLRLGEALANLLSGIAPGVTARPAPDDLEMLVASSGTAEGARFAGYADFVLARQPAYPLKDRRCLSAATRSAPLPARSHGRKE